jgi:hypothetical protein
MKSKENGGVKFDFWSATVLFEYTQWTHVTDKLSHNTEYPAKTTDLQLVTDKLSYKPVHPENSTDLPQVTDKLSILLYFDLI